MKKQLNCHPKQLLRGTCESDICVCRELAAVERNSAEGTVDNPDSLENVMGSCWLKKTREFDNAEQFCVPDHCDADDLTQKNVEDVQTPDKSFTAVEREKTANKTRLMSDRCLLLRDDRRQTGFSYVTIAFRAQSTQTNCQLNAKPALLPWIVIGSQTPE